MVGGWRLAVDGWWRWAVGGGRRLAVGDWRLAVDGWWRWAVGGGWRLAVGGWRSLGLSLKEQPCLRCASRTTFGVPASGLQGTRTGMTLRNTRRASRIAGSKMSGSMVTESKWMPSSGPLVWIREA